MLYAFHCRKHANEGISEPKRRRTHYKREYGPTNWRTSSRSNSRIFDANATTANVFRGSTTTKRKATEMQPLLDHNASVDHQTDSDSNKILQFKLYTFLYEHDDPSYRHQHIQGLRNMLGSLSAVPAPTTMSRSSNTTYSNITEPSGICMCLCMQICECMYVYICICLCIASILMVRTDTTPSTIASEVIVLETSTHI